MLNVASIVCNVAWLAFATLISVSANAQEAPKQVPKAQSGEGLVFYATAFDGCIPETAIGQIVGGKYVFKANISAMIKPLRMFYKNVEPHPLPAGEYVVGMISCPTGRQRINGPFAKFQVRAGEVVDVGTLRIKHQTDNILLGTGTMTLSIEGMNPERLEEARKLMPQAISKMVKRPMVLVGPAERKVRTIAR